MPSPARTAATLLPNFYCDPCKAQWDKKQQEDDKREAKERQRKNKRQREYYQINKAIRQPIACATCGDEFESRRSDAKYCSAACRQRAYVKRDGKASNARPLRSRDIERAIKTAFTTKPDSAFTTEDLCNLVYSGLQQVERKHRAAVLPIAKKVCEQLETSDLCWDWYQPAFFNRFVVWNRVESHFKRHRALETIRRPMQTLKKNNWPRFLPVAAGTTKSLRAACGGGLGKKTLRNSENGGPFKNDCGPSCEPRPAGNRFMSDVKRTLARCVDRFGMALSRCRAHANPFRRDTVREVSQT